MSTNFEHRKIQILEAPGVKYQKTKFEQYPKVLRQAVKNGEISYQAGWLWLTISELAGDDRAAYAGQEYLADALGSTVPTIKRWTKELENTGWLVKQNRTATSNKYWLSIPMEYDVLDKDYIARISTVGQELSTGKRSTRAKNPPAVEGYSHKLTDDPMELDNTNSSHKLTDELSNKLTDELSNKLTDELLKRQSFKETEHNDTELTKMDQGVTTVNQGSSLAETNTPLVSSGQDYKEILVEEIAVLPSDSLVKTIDVVDLGKEEVVVSSGKTKSPGYSSVTSKEEVPSSGLAIVNEDDLVKKEEKKKVSLGPSKKLDVDNERVTKAMEEYRAKKAKRSSWGPSKKTEPLDVVDASLSASGAVEVPGVPEISVKPQKPVQRVPERSQWDDDARYESKVAKADMSFTMAMGKYKQDLKVWENKYGDTTTTQAPAQSTTEPMRFRAQAY